MEEFGWLIEFTSQHPSYWLGQDRFTFTGNADNAVRFSRQKDAEKVRHGIIWFDLVEMCKSIEHGWSM